jgi:hypothetical protein
MENFVKYSFYLRDLNLDLENIKNKTGEGFNNEIIYIINCFSGIKANGGFSVYPSGNLDFSLGSRILRVLRNSDRSAIFVVTLGKGYNEISERYRGDPLLYYLTDIIASEYTELAADYIHSKIAEYASGLSLNYSNRYSPGYCGWNTAEQKILFSYLPPAPCGIRLTSSSLMDPVKSVSGLVALGKDVKFKKYDCSQCNDEECLYRKKIIL